MTNKIFAAPVWIIMVLIFSTVAELYLVAGSQTINTFEQGKDECLETKSAHICQHIALVQHKQLLHCYIFSPDMSHMFYLL